VTATRDEVFGAIVDSAMRLSAEGMCVAEVWANLPRHYTHVSLDAFVVMPNHVHGILVLGPDAIGGASRAPLPEVVRGFKTYAARRVNGLRGVSGAPVWQRNYYERIIRDEQELQNVRRYIAENPAHWHEDSENPRRPC
jgi:REP element-mobilizing transposase RayT